MTELDKDERARLEFLEGYVEKQKRMMVGLQYKLMEEIKQFLGPNALKVLEKWQKEDVLYVRYSWGEGAHNLSGEERAAAVLAFDNVPKKVITSIDGDIERTQFNAPVSDVPVQDVRDLC